MITAHADAEAIVTESHDDPTAVLGPHMMPKGGVCIVAFLPLAAAVIVHPLAGQAADQQMSKVHAAGLFEALFPDAPGPFRYRFRATQPDGGTIEIDDPYAYPPLLGDLDLYLLGEGTQTRAWELLGAHPRQVQGTPGVHFAVWAPNARWVSVVGDFNNWDTRRHPMCRRNEGGVWELFIPAVGVGARYKYHIRSRLQDYTVDKTDPYGFTAEVRPLTASIVADISDFTWHDQDWMARRDATTLLDKPLTIYEVHLGSWRRNSDGTFLNYRELAHQLVDYVKSMGFTHLELMPVTEHPFDVSWGYQTTGYYAVTSRFGSPRDFMYLIDHCHRNGIGVFIDWVPSHFAKEGHGLGFFDGAHIYEHADPRQGEHLDWGTYVFNYGRGEVLTFLLSNALFWLEIYHVDGFRVDAVASMLYLDHQRAAGAWVPNKYGGHENLEAVAFLRSFNELVHARFPGAVTMAEESTSWPMVSGPTYLGGLGFTMKWNMGWMHDTLEYIKADPVYRRSLHNTLTFSMLYNYTENFVLPLSHDEVVHGKSPLVYKAPGDEWQKFATLRLLLGYMWGHPGKKLLFMGGEFGQTAEWNFDAELQWQLQQFPAHQGVHEYVRALNALYASHQALWVLDFDPAGFEWIDVKDVDQSVIIMMRRGQPDPLLLPEDVPAALHDTAARAAEDRVEQKSAGDARAANEAAAAIRAARQRAIDRSRPFLIIACNFTPIVRSGYQVGVPVPGGYRETLNSDDRRFGGSGVINQGLFVAQTERIHDREQAITITLPPLGISVLEWVPDDPS